MPILALFALDGLPCLDPRRLAADCAAHGWRVAEGVNSFRTTRGRQSGVGRVLLTGEQVTTILKRKDGTHELRTACGDTSLSFQGLWLGGEIWSPVPNAANFADNPRAPYVVELRDVRELGRQSSHAYQYQVTSPDGGTFHETDGWTWVDILTHVWKSLPSEFGKPPELPSLPDYPPRNLRFPGLNAWEVYNRLLDLLGFSVVVGHDGRCQVVNLSAEDRDTANTLSDLARLLVDTDAAPPNTLVAPPATVRVHFHARYYEFQTSSDQPSAEDVWQTRSVYYLDVDTKPWREGKEPDSPSTVAPLWGTLEASFDHSGNVTNRNELLDQARALAETHVKAVVRAGSRTHAFYSGLLDLIPGSVVSGVAWHDLGGSGPADGLVTEVVQTAEEAEGLLSGNPPRDQSQRGNQSGGSGGSLQSFLSRESSGPPDFARPHTPYSRRVLGELKESLAPCGTAEVAVLYWNGKDWCKSNQTVSGQDVFGFTRDVGTRVWLAWNYQAQAWIIVATVPKIPTVWECVTPGSDVTTFRPLRQYQADRLVVDKHSSLRLRWREPQRPAPAEGEENVSPCPVPPYNDAILDIVSGVSYSVFGHGGGGPDVPPQWTDTPRVGQGIHVGMTGRGYVNYADKGFTELAGGPWGVIWPVAAAPVAGARLVADVVDGDCVQLGWDRKRCGLSGYYCVNGYDESLGCLGTSVILYFEQGNLVWDSSQGSASTTCFTPSGSLALCAVVPGTPHDPCRDPDPLLDPNQPGGAQGGSAVEELLVQIDLITQTKVSAAQAYRKARALSRLKRQLAKAKFLEARAKVQAKRDANVAAAKAQRIQNRQNAKDAADARRSLLIEYRENVRKAKHTYEGRVATEQRLLRELLKPNMTEDERAVTTFGYQQGLEVAREDYLADLASLKANLDANLAALPQR